MFERILAIAESDSHRLDELMAIAGGDPNTFYIGGEMAGLDLHDSDVAGLNFHAADMRGANLSAVKNVDQAIFTKATKLDGVILPEGVMIGDLKFQDPPPNYVL